MPSQSGPESWGVESGQARSQQQADKAGKQGQQEREQGPGWVEERGCRCKSELRRHIRDLQESRSKLTHIFLLMPQVLTLFLCIENKLSLTRGPWKMHGACGWEQEQQL